MQSLPVFVLNTWYALVATVAMAIILYAQSLITNEPIRFFAYDREQYLYAMGACSLNVIGMTCQTIAL